MRLLAAAVVVAAALLFPANPALAITPDQVVAMAKAGVSETVILAVIDRDGGVFDLGADQLVALKHAGLSDAIIVAMLKSGRAEASADVQPAVLAPDVLIIGHGPEIPNTLYWDRLYWNPTYVIPFIPPIASYVGANPVPFAPIVPHVAPYPVRRADPQRERPRRTAR